MALGATSAGVVRVLLLRTLRLVCVGLVLGTLGALLVDSALSRLMFGVSLGRFEVLAAMSALLLGIAGLASWLPGTRAAKVDAARALATDP